MIVGVILIVLLLLIPVFMVVSIYNALIKLRNRVKNAWSQIDVQLKRRYDLIPNLVETAKGYLKHEREVLENVTKARTQAIKIDEGVAQQAKAENFLSQTLRSLFAVVENYPDLKASRNMLAVQEELTSTENKISFARQHYNDSVMKVNTKIEIFPSNIVAGMFSFKQEEFFEVEEEERKAVKVKF
ncbi:MAG: LemA family protein [Candidatus Aureabacteria bacterium]|nr:LemA family protein [Candidatus Auribacterota bacterium]